MTALCQPSMRTSKIPPLQRRPSQRLLSQEALKEKAQEQEHPEHRNIGEVHEHGGGPGEENGKMVPRTHVHGKLDADKHKEFHWSYARPEIWGDGYDNCDGTSQSPINVVTSELASTGKTLDVLLDHMEYVALSDRILINHGHNVQVNGLFGKLRLSDGVYQAKQFHFHFPSEHEVDGKLAAGEIHIVHQKEGAKGTEALAVIGILLDEGSPSNAQLAFFQNLGFGKHLPEENVEYNIADPVDLNSFKDQFAGGFFHYDGSLTTPPCSQTVHWYVLEKRAQVTKDMVETFKSLYPSPSNNRPVQPLNGRKIVHSKLDLQESAQQSGAFFHSPCLGMLAGILVSFHILLA